VHGGLVNYQPTRGGDLTASNTQKDRPVKILIALHPQKQSRSFQPGQGKS